MNHGCLHSDIKEVIGADSPLSKALSTRSGPDAIDNLKTIAISRLMLDNFDHIRSYWVMLAKPPPRPPSTAAPTTSTAPSPTAAN